MVTLNQQALLPKYKREVAKQLVENETKFLGGLEDIYGSWAYDIPKYGWEIVGDKYVVTVILEEPKDLQAKLQEMGRIKKNF